MCLGNYDTTRLKVRTQAMLALFRETARKLASLSSLRGDEYVREDIDTEDIQSKIVPKALALFKSELPDDTFCDSYSTPLVSLARRVSDLLLIEFSCRDPAAVVGAMLADLPNKKDVELQILEVFGQDYVKVWKEVKLFLDPRKCEVSDVLVMVISNIFLCRQRVIKMILSVQTGTASSPGCRGRGSPTAPGSPCCPGCYC